MRDRDFERAIGALAFVVGIVIFASVVSVLA